MPPDTIETTLDAAQVLARWEADENTQSVFSGMQSLLQGSMK